MECGAANTLSACLPTFLLYVYLSAYLSVYTYLSAPPSLPPHNGSTCWLWLLLGSGKSESVVSPFSPFYSSSLQRRPSFTALTCAHRRRTRRRIINERWLLQPPVEITHFIPHPHSLFFFFWLDEKRIFIHPTEFFEGKTCGKLAVSLEKKDCGVKPINFLDIGYGLMEMI